MLKVIILLYSYILARPDHNDMHAYVYAFANSIANTIRAYQKSYVKYIYLLWTEIEFYNKYNWNEKEVTINLKNI